MGPEEPRHFFSIFLIQYTRNDESFKDASVKCIKILPEMRNVVSGTVMAARAFYHVGR